MFFGENISFNCSIVSSDNSIPEAWKLSLKCLSLIVPGIGTEVKSCDNVHAIAN